VEQGERVGQVEAEQGSLDHAGTGEVERRRQQSQCHDGGYAPMVGDSGGEGFLQLEGSMEGVRGGRRRGRW
jgi:hypothetical protein